MIVMKFGGTSVANCEAISRTIEIIRTRLADKPVVVVSALSKITDLLYGIADAASRKDREECKKLLQTLRDRHIALCHDLMPGSRGNGAVERVTALCDELDIFASAVCALGELSDRSKAVIISYGEFLSSNIIACAMNDRGIKTNLMNSRKMVITNSDNLKGEPVFAEIQARVPQEVEAAFSDGTSVEAVITQGFVASSEDGEPTVLGRGGSDYTASLIGMASDSERIEIWTDVDGVRTADPRKVNGTLSLEKLSFEEASEMAHFGAKVLHPLTIEPAVMKNIPIYVLNSMNPEGKGTAILQSEFIEDGVKSVSFKENILVINIFSTEMIGASGFLKKVFGVFSENKVSVDLVSTTEANISVTVEENQKNIEAVLDTLARFAKVEVNHDKAQISVIGKNISAIKGMLKGIFTPVDGHRVYMISQGASDINVSFVVDKELLSGTVQSLHDLLFHNK